MNNFELFRENNLTKRTEKNTKRNFGDSCFPYGKQEEIPDRWS
jgi:hypothetical protein